MLKWYDKVRIKSGFYDNCEGKVIEFIGNYTTKYSYYDVEVGKLINQHLVTKVVRIEEGDLEKI